MDGLECSEILLSKALSDTDYFRLESEYYNAAMFSFPHMLKGSDVKKGVQYGTSKVCDEEAINGYPVLRLNELHKGFIEKPQKYCHIISKNEYESLRLNKGDVLIIRTNGNPDLVGRAAVVMEDTEYAFASYLFRVFSNGIMNPYSIVAFLSSKYGRIEVDKNSMKGNQTNFSPAKFCDISIPLLCNDLQAAIGIVFEKAYACRCNSDVKYTEASNLLVSVLGINQGVSGENHTVKTFSKSFGASGRLDAEYYQPKYDAITAMLNAKETVGSLRRIHDNTFVPKQDVEYSYIELSDIGIGGNISSAASMLGMDLPSRARRQVKKGQVLVSSIEGSLESCALVPEEYDNALCSTGFYVVDSDKINSESLLVLFQSEPIQALLKQRCSGTILTAISKDELQRMPLPLIDAGTQREIAEKVQESMFLRSQSRHLIDVAVRAVEIAIEQDEDAAIEYIRQNT